MGMDEFGDEMIKEIINEGDLFGEVGLEGEMPDDEYAQVLTDDTVCVHSLFRIFNTICKATMHLL